MPLSKARFSYSTRRGASPGGGSMSVNLSVQQVLSLWVQGSSLQQFPEMWYWVFLWCLFSSLVVHGAAGLLMLIVLQRHKWGRLITLVLVSTGFLASLSGAVVTTQRSGLMMMMMRRMMKGCLLPTCSSPTCLFIITTNDG
ncbi:transmembrane protein 170B isoform X2 [Nothobranchius furzeri]|uniref:Transcript variant X3 n=1 Tax=Nothobranchius furzeri TaxID=105023 RepID=A0A1A8ABQ4_NOTFU|nr:transmembrane protein 170B isoform X2 [Nothobranchius furzeri]XP_054601506.1 transmembrane protein 170B isoform X2 [Nothobranchius furzeri]KAF7211411.1 transcript variant X3 [Nothobranchius furzeri]